MTDPVKNPSYLIIERGPDAGQRILLDSFPVKIGRDKTNTIVTDDNEVSRFHLQIKKRGRLFIAQDLDSRNGTFINGDRILNAVVQNGDKILVGSMEYQFVTSERDIHLANEIMQYDMLVSEELGINGPIELGQHSASHFTPIRLNETHDVNPFGNDSRMIKSIFELHSNILIMPNLEEAANSLLKSLGVLCKKASRAAYFLWSESNRQLIPVAKRQFTKDEQSFILSQNALDDVIIRKQGVLLQPNTPNSTNNNRSRLVLPMIHNSFEIGVVHIEMDTQKSTFKENEVRAMQTLISRCAPIFESLLLRREIDSWMVGMIETLIATIEAKDTYTQGHSERVSRYSLAIADELKLNRELKRLLLVSSLCHDVGKIGIPDAILKKASLLSSEEYEEMKLHPTIGAEIIRHMPNAHRILSGVKHHHEKWDGTGYPDGLMGEDIPFFGRIVAIADVFDAMISGRAYSGFIDESNAIEKINEESDLFDPEILKAFTRAYENGTLTLKTGTGSNQEGDADT